MNPTIIRRAVWLLLIMLGLFACTTPPGEDETSLPQPIVPSVTPAPEAVEPVGLAPIGDPGETYYAPFNVAITLDGDLGEWQDIPTVTLPYNADLTTDNHAITFAAAADETYLYLMGDLIDNNIISGQHDINYWNEDSVEFYINGTGELGLTSYGEGVAQITIPALNFDQQPGTEIIAGINGPLTGAQVVVIRTSRGYALEVAVPLVNDLWDLTPAHGKTIGFQVHVNGASVDNRNSKLIWSIYDPADHSYQDPSLFGKLIFFQTGSTDRPEFNPTPQPAPTPTNLPVEPNPAYKDPTLSPEQRVADLLPRMSLSEKLGQMTQIEKDSIGPALVGQFFLGSVLSGGGGSPNVNTPEAWSKMINRYQEAAMETRLGIPIIYGVDAVHGHNNMRLGVIFPHNIGLGAAADESLMERIGQVTASEMVATGVYWDFAPVLAVVQDIRWGRTYESYSENTDLVSRLSTAYIRGLQGASLSAPTSVAATIKHYVGDGGTSWGTSTTADYKLDQGVTDVDEATLRAIHLPPYIAGLEAGARTVMISYSSWGGMKMHAQHYLITEVLKGELGFTGFVVSDWGGIDQIDSTNYYNSVVAGINAGIDMNMVPYDDQRFLSTLASAVNKGDVSLERIDDAVRRILLVKFEMGLFEHPYANEAELALVGSPEHRAVAREAVAKSLVLLKNENSALPLSKDTPLIYLAGVGADDIGMALGGWSVEWQGKMGETTEGTTLVEAVRAAVSPAAQVQYDPAGNFPAGTLADACIVVVGEEPYAEGVGDKDDLTLSQSDQDLAARMRPLCQKLVVVLYSGRPMVITDQLPQWDAFVAAWLPGTECQGITDVLFGDVPFTGKLPFTWPRTNAQLPFDFANLGTGEDAPLFPFGYGQ